MKAVKVRTPKSFHPVPSANRREHLRLPATFCLMYSAQATSGDVLIGDGTVTDLSSDGLGVRGNSAVQEGQELTMFLYLPDGQDPLFVMETRVAWSSGHRFGVKFSRMNLREKNRLRYFLSTNASLMQH